jgi:hypothetical protein
VTLSKVKEGIAIAPMLLNPGDRFFIEIFSKSPLEIANVTSRIVGIPSLSHAKPEPQSGFYIGLSSLGILEKSTSSAISGIPFWLVFVVTHMLLIGTLLNVGVFVTQTSLGAKTITFIFSAATYSLVLVGYSLCISYFIEVLDLKKWPGLAILVCCVLMSGYTATKLRRKFFQNPDM